MTAGRPLAVKYGRRMAEEMLRPDGPAFGEQLDKVRARRAAMTGDTKPGA
jgi:hypothetical protein